MKSIDSVRGMKKIGAAPWISAMLIFAAIIVFGSTGTANAAVNYGFYSISNNNPGDVAIGEAQLSVDVYDDSGTLYFQFFNAGPEDSSITRIYFDDDAALLSGFAGNPTSPDPGVSFSIGANPGNLPAGLSITPQFIADYSVGANPPVQPNGVNPNETLFVPFNYVGDFSSVINAMDTATLRVGIHVQGFESGGSESFVNIPEPGSIILGTIGLLSASFIKRRRLV